MRLSTWGTRKANLLQCLVAGDGLFYGVDYLYIGG